MAGFTANKTSGCSPLTNVQFTDQSTGSPTSWVWKKNGVQFSTLQNPSATFGIPGSYIISLTVSNSSGSNTASATITVYGNPTSNFAATSATSGCVPHTVSFQDNSSGNNSTIVSRLWSFGDGGQSSLTNPPHKYTLAGNFPVSLKVVDNHGCEDTKQIPNYIQTYQLPNVSFNSNSVRIACTAPLTVVFTNSSTGTGTLSYLWKFGDGSTSTSATPSHTYNSMGVYNVKLIVTDNNSCSDSLTYVGFVKIQAINADFSASSDSLCLGDSMNFVNNSQGALSYSWNFGDNTTASGMSVSHLYADSGWHQVRMIASVPSAGCADTAFKQIYTQRVVANFRTEPGYVCQLPQEVFYRNLSVNGSAYRWYRGYRCPDLPPPRKCGVNEKGDTVLFHKLLYDVERIFKDTMVVTSKLGCIDTMVKDSSVIISLVRTGPLLSQVKGCRPYQINFSGVAFPYNASVYIPSPPSTLISFEWIIDDTTYSTLQNAPTLTVTDTGLWKGIFKVENSLGCRDSMPFTIRAGDSVKADFVMLHDTVCVSEFDSAISLSQDTNYINEYKWQIKPGSAGGNGRTAYFKANKIGYVQVTHIADHHGCADTLVVPNAFYAEGPLVDFQNSLFDCTDSTRIKFYGLMQQAYRWYWNFGDSNLAIDSVNVNPIVSYSKKGNYSVTLTAYNQDSSCMDTHHDFIIAGNIKARLKSDTGNKSTNLSDYKLRDTILGCVPMNVYFTASGSAATLSADWYIDNQAFKDLTRDSILTYFFTQRGYHQVMLVVKDTVAGCSDTSYAVVVANKPIADFTGSPHEGCLPLHVLLQDTVNSLNKITHYFWQVGPYIDSAREFTKTFNTAVNYNAKLIVSDTVGCSDTVVKLDYVKSSSFNIDFYATNVRQLCAGDSLKFAQVYNTPNVSYVWIFGSGDTAYGASPWQVFKDSGLFDVKMIARDSAACVKELLKPDYIAVQAYPNTDFYAIPTDSTCYPLPVQFYADTSILYYEDNAYYYTLGSFSAASNYKDPFYNYVRPGSYTVKLTVTTTFGCKESKEKINYININGPYGEIAFEPDSVCRGDSVKFEMLNPINTLDWGWDFGDGNGILNVNPVYHVYTDSIGRVFPSLYFSDTSGGCAKYFTDTMYIFETVAEFTIADTIGCVPFDLEIKNKSTQSNKYAWKFGDGTVANTRNPTKIYNKAGRYIIELSVKGGAGCSDTAIQIIDVFPVPVAMAERDTLICEGDTVQLFSAGGEAYLWSPAKSLNNYQISDPRAFPIVSTGYEVLVTDSNGCEDIDSVYILVQNPIKLDLEDLVMIIGDTLTLSNAYGGKGVTYKWIPSEGLSCDTCMRPLLTALVSGQYTVIVSDTNGCFSTATVFNLEVENKYTLDVPEAFTPNGDGVNDIIYVRGWGLKNLITFKIYNRWGEMIFESNDLSVGWDGRYKGNMQGVETYVYYVEALTYGNEILKKKGNINLLR